MASLSNGKCLRLNTDIGYIYLAKKNGSLYFASTYFVNKVDESNEEYVSKMYDHFKNKRFFIKCSFEPLKDNTPIKEIVKGCDGYISFSQEIISSKEKNEIYNKNLGYELSFKINDYEEVSIDYVSLEFYKPDWYKKVKQKDIDSKPKSYKIDSSSEESLKDSVNKLKDAFETLEEFEYIADDDKKYIVHKINGHAYIKIRNKERPAIVNDAGVIVAFS